MARRVQKAATVVACPVPPPDPRPFVPPITLPTDRSTNFLALHARVVGYMMHWIDGRPLPHFREREWCAGCRMGQTPQWKGFIGVVSTLTHNRFILQIPPAAFRCSGLFKDKSDAGLLTGVVFTGFRFGDKPTKQSPAKIVLVDQVVPFPRSSPFPLLAALARYWNMENLDGLDQVNEPMERIGAGAAWTAARAEYARRQQQNGKEVK
jgi:hypothetical protein